MQTTNKNIQVISILTIFFFILFLFFSKRAYSDDLHSVKFEKNNFTKYLEIYEKPKNIQDLYITNQDREKITISKFSNKLTVINIWATWCLPCIEELPALNDFIKSNNTNNKDSNYRFITLSVDIDGAKRVLPFLKKMKIFSFPVYYDPKSELLKELKISRLPTTIFLDLDGGVIASLQGTFTWKLEETYKLLQKIYLN